MIWHKHNICLFKLIEQFTGLDSVLSYHDFKILDLSNCMAYDDDNVITQSVQTYKPKFLNNIFPSNPLAWVYSLTLWWKVASGLICRIGYLISNQIRMERLHLFISQGTIRHRKHTPLWPLSRQRLWGLFNSLKEAFFHYLFMPKFSRNWTVFGQTLWQPHIALDIVMPCGTSSSHCSQCSGFVHSVLLERKLCSWEAHQTHYSIWPIICVTVSI